MLKLDYTLTSSEERRDYVNKLVAEIGENNLNAYALEILTNYLVFNMDKEEKRSKQITTDNRQMTIDKREMSLEGLTERLENGEDGVYNLIANDKNIIFAPKIEITKKDIAEIPMLGQLRQTIDNLATKTYTGKDAYTLKKTLIQLRQDQYIIKAAYRKPIYFLRAGRGSQEIDWSEQINVDSEGNIHYTGNCTLYNPKHVSALLTNYTTLKQNSYEELHDDIKWLLEDLDLVTEAALLEEPLYRDLLIYKIDGRSNVEIQILLERKHGTRYSLEYLSSLWRNKIPKMIAEYCQNQWLVWHYTFEEKGQWKKCSRCGEIKLAHNNFFSKNSTSKDKFYSICKCCRNSKGAK